MLFDDLGRLAEALVGVERSFGTAEEEIIQSLVRGGFRVGVGRGFVGRQLVQRAEAALPVGIVTEV